jgi:hypothetical protein
MHTKAHALANVYVIRRDVLYSAHQAKAFITIDQGYVERPTFWWVHDGCGVNGSQTLASAPFQPIAAGERAEYTRIEYGSSRVWTELVSQLAAFEVVDIRLERRVLIVGHARRKSKKFMSGANGSNPAAERGSM